LQAYIAVNIHLNFDYKISLIYNSYTQYTNFIMKGISFGCQM